ncbi:hypothetical protein HYU17_05150 [Candidatus Woesearchaeota archaeon]|nr:hypothetical protein [Candidatus Woesearchaeota archaeon]
MKIVFGSEKWLSQDTRLIKRGYRVEPGEASSESFIFALQYLWFHENKWLEVARIDNYPHESKQTGAHIHKFGSDFVEFREMNFTEAAECIISVGENTKKKLLLGDYDGEN